MSGANCLCANIQTYINGLKLPSTVLLYSLLVSQNLFLFDFRKHFCTGSGKITIKQLSDVAGMIREHHVKNIVVVAGAGISTPSGIPDFR